MRRLLSDLHFALRQLRKAPIFTVTILAVLALGIGATTAIFGLFDQVLLRQLPVVRPQELVRLQGHAESFFNDNVQSIGGNPDETLSFPAYRYLRDNTAHIFSGVLASSPENPVGISWQGQTNLAIAELVSGNYFQVLGVDAAVGRTILPADDIVKLGSPVIMLSYGYWQSRFGGDPGVIGRSLPVNGHPFTIVGVASLRFRSVSAGEVPDLFVPMLMKPAITPGLDNLEDHTSRWLNVVARITPGVTLTEARAAIQPIWHAERAVDFSYQLDRSAAVRTSFVDRTQMNLLSGATGFSPARDGLATPMKALMGMAAMVLLMACANVASLLLVRAAGRVREISVRYALGARRWRIVQQLLAEGLLLGLLGGALGLLLARPVSSLLARYIQGLSSFDVPNSPEVELRLLLVALGVTLATSLAFSLAPAIQFWRPDLTPALKQQSPTLSGGALLLRRVTVGAQIALSVLLLAAAGLFLRTMNNLRAEDLGFRPDHLIQFDLDPQLAGYKAEAATALDERIVAILRSLPGVQSVSAGDDPEMADNVQMAKLAISGYTPSRSEEMQIEWSGVMPGYLETIGVPLIAGRPLNAADRKGAAPVLLISQSAAIHYFGSVQNALGHTLKGDEQQRTIVGVFGEFRHFDLREPIQGRALVPCLQQDPHQLTFFLRTAAAPGTMMETVRKALHQFDSRLALQTLETMDSQLDQLTAQEHMLALLATSFGVLAALMAAIGLYGVLAFDTVQRTREIGIRMALGASRPQVARLLLLETLRLAGISILISLPLAWGFARLAKSLLFGVRSADPLTFFAVSMLVALVSLAASAVPTWRAASIEPMRALRYE